MEGSTEQGEGQNTRTLIKSQDKERYPCPCPLGSRATSREDDSFRPFFFFLFSFFRPPSSGRNWADDLNARTTTNGSPRWYLTARRRSVSRASTGRRFAVCGPCASVSFVWNLDGSFSADVTVLGRVWAKNVPSENSDTSISITKYYL